MAGSSDKARFYLEQSVPELQDLHRKKIFTKEEITSIAKKRSDFEHKLNARGSQPVDYARYAEYEMNLESLRKKRVQRMGIKTRTYSGQRRILFILERATRKFHGDMGLWMQYVDFARKQKSTKRLSEVLTRVLRMHPTKPGLWIYAANYALDERSDMTEARSYMQRGLRFCKNSQHLWSEYAKLEMIYIARIVARGRDLSRNEDLWKKDALPRANAPDADVIPLPPITAWEDNLHPEPGFIDQNILKCLGDTPVISGAIPMAIFDGAINQFPGDATLGETFFNIVVGFQDLPCASKISQHIINHLLTTAPSDPAALICYVRQPVIGVQTFSSDFPGALGISLERLKSALKTVTSSRATHELSRARSLLSRRAIEWILQFVVEDLDPDISRVISMTLQKLWSQYQSDIRQSAGTNSEDFLNLFHELRRKGFKEMAEPGRSLASHLWPTDLKILGLSELKA
ncbi:U3 snoRNP protein [Pseudocyphellaria aurata]|nr:U3 snoRNP protein [Pseudocyphellaria aurata]